MAAVGADADAVDARAAHHRDAPAALGAGAQDGERVVADAQALGPAAVDRGVQPLLLDRQVEPGQQQVADRGAPVAGEPRAGARVRVQLLEHRDRAVEPDVVGRADAAAHEREHLAVLAQQRQVGLRVAAVDGEHEPPAHRTGSPASSRSTSSPAISSWPISGWASSALRTSSGLPDSAARTASRS